MEINWTVEYSLDITDGDLENMAEVANDYIREGYEREEAIHEAVNDYLMGLDDCIYYSITEEAGQQIEDTLNEHLTQ